MSLSNSIQCQEPIAIVGIGCRLPGDINSINDFWQVLKNGNDVIAPNNVAKVVIEIGLNFFNLL